MSDCTVYIDEAGDLGTKKGTRWFVLTAVVVDKKNESSIRTNLAQIKTRLNVKCIHIRELRDYNKRAFVARELNEEQFTFMCVIADTQKLDPAKLPSTDPLSVTAYNYSCRLLLERVSWFLRDSGKVADIVLSARGTKRDSELIDYITNKLLPYPDNQIVENVFDKISAKSAGSWDLLQLADVCATSTFLAYEVNGWEIRTPCFLKTLSSHLYKYNGKTDKYGIKYFSSNMKPITDELKCNWACKEKERTPGVTST